MTLRAMFAGLHEVPVREEIACDHCENDCAGEVTNIGAFVYHADCAVAVAAGIAMSVMGGGDERVTEVRHAADVLEMAVRVMRSHLAGRVA